MAQSSAVTIHLNPQHDPTHTVVFLHGRGSTAAKFAATLAYSRPSNGLTLMQTFPNFRWVFPNAQLRRVAALPHNPPVPQWFDIWNVSDFSDREEMQAVGLRESVAMVRQVLAEEATRLGGRWDRIILMGISQGAATSVHTLLNLNLDSLPIQVQGERRLAGFIGFSCRMPFPGRSLADTRKVLGLSHVPEDNELLRNTPVLLEHCTDDHLILVASGCALRDTLQHFGAEVEWKEYERGGHWFNAPHGIDDAVHFLNTRVLDPFYASGSASMRASVSSGAMDLD